MVWLGKNTGTSEKAAIKQFAKGNGSKGKSDFESCQVEVQVGTVLFPHPKGSIDQPSSGVSEERPYPGIQNIAGFISCINDTRDVWLVYEVGGASLTKLLFDVKGTKGSNL